MELPRDVPMQTHVVSWTPPADAMCGAGVGDASGDLAFATLWDHTTGIDVVSPLGGTAWQTGGEMDTEPIPLSSGFLGLGTPYLGPCSGSLGLYGYDASTQARAGPIGWGTSAFVAARNPRGGAFIAGDLSLQSCAYDAPLSPSAVMLGDDPASLSPRWGPVPLSASGAVLGAEVDVRGRALVITDGGPTFGSGVVSAQWFDADGTPLTGEFALFRGVSAPLPTFDASPLLGGGLLIGTFGADARYARAHLLPLATLESGGNQPRAPPVWIQQRPDTRLQILPSQKGYAVLPLPKANAPCGDTLEVVDALGTSCGTHVYTAASGSCTTGGLGLSLDGTVIQPLPRSLEVFGPYGDQRTCTWRYWPGAVH